MPASTMRTTLAADGGVFGQFPAHSRVDAYFSMCSKRIFFAVFWVDGMFSREGRSWTWYALVQSQWRALIWLTGPSTSFWLEEARSGEDFATSGSDVGDRRMRRELRITIGDVGSPELTMEADKPLVENGRCD